MFSNQILHVFLGNSNVNFISLLFTYHPTVLDTDSCPLIHNSSQRAREIRHCAHGPGIPDTLWAFPPVIGDYLDLPVRTCFSQLSSGESTVWMVKVMAGGSHFRGSLMAGNLRTDQQGENSLKRQGGITWGRPGGIGDR